LKTLRRIYQNFVSGLQPNTLKGDLVATVSKKRKGNCAAVFDINLGDGRFINLSDPKAFEELDEIMKNEAFSQLQTLQDQMAKLMSQLKPSSK